MTGTDHQHSAAVEEAAQWLSQQQEVPRPAVPHLRNMFGLHAVEAVEAIRLADQYRAKGRATG
ncbi:hypothetical protein E2A64_05550 [Pseudohoeflea suaedae]|uniref:Uncharacterized protein n=1 Tax=Pseudohoeflea suaedae TaxID=877384 RepID=A0A4R5PNF7_9HYPH|nr:hypothetical protein [Pseudohoeflea suaedae]TDH38566.1 hypothetical protein E2A64_05550 [Pseudohoeflea suaedae]